MNPISISVDFNLFPDDHVLGTPVSLGGFTFTALNGKPLAVNETANERGLTIHDDGLKVDLPAPSQVFSFRLGTFNGPVTFDYYDENGNKVGAKKLDFGNAFQTLSVSLKHRIAHIQFVGGGNEGLLGSITVTYYGSKESIQILT